MGLITKIEDVIAAPMEFFHQRRGFQPVDLGRMALRCMERGCRQGLRAVFAPNCFRIFLSPEDYDELQPFREVIRSDVSHELSRVASERHYLLAADLVIEIVRDTNTPVGQPRVKGHMQGQEEPVSVISFIKDGEGAAANEGDAVDQGPQEQRQDPPRLDGKTILLLPPDE